MDKAKRAKIVAMVVKKIIRNSKTAGEMDLSSAFDCAGFEGHFLDDTDPVYGDQHICGITNFQTWLEEDPDDLGFDFLTVATAAAFAYQHVKRENKIFNGYWDCH